MNTETIITGRTVEAYGYKVVKNFPLSTIKDTELLIGSKKVEGYDINLFEGKIPIHYVLRESDGIFICGFDLVDDNKFWFGLESNYQYSNPQDIYDYVENLWPGFRLCLEDSMGVQDKKPLDKVTVYGWSSNGDQGYANIHVDGADITILGTKGTVSKLVQLIKSSSEIILSM